MLHIDHIAIWVADLEATHAFYAKYFDVQAGERYHNPAKGFTSYFLSAPGGGARIELMHRSDARANDELRDLRHGLTHFALTIGDHSAVDALTERLRSDGHVVAGEPRTTGDGYYESVVEDPEGNRIELVAAPA